MNKWINQLESAFGLLDGMELEEKFRATLKRACSECMVRAIDEDMSSYSRRNAGHKWSADDLSEIETTLTNAKMCESWDEERIICQMLSERLGRPEKIVKRKAIELGHASKVDYWINRKPD